MENELTGGSDWIALVLGLSKKTIQRFESQHPERLPHCLKVGRKRIYIKKGVEQWLISKQEINQQELAALTPSSPKAKAVTTGTGTGRPRGRPRKVLAVLAQQGGAAS